MMEKAAFSTMNDEELVAAKHTEDRESSNHDKVVTHDAVAVARDIVDDEMVGARNMFIP